MPVASDLLERVERELDLLFADKGAEQSGESATEVFAAECRKAHRHPLLAGGKRIRPLLLLYMAGAIAGDEGVEAALPAALALELVHTYSLVHDDLPCMDNDDFRRGKPTTHKLFGEAKALLVGDGLLTKAFSLLGQAPRGLVEGGHGCFGKLAAAYGCAAGALGAAAGDEGMVLGQWLDISEGGANSRSSWHWVERVAREKTGRLLGAALEMGFFVGMVPRLESGSAFVSLEVTRQAGLARSIGIHAGIAFQCVDDILDVTASTESMGKTVGKDAAQGKATAITALGMAGARSMAEEHTRLALEKLAALRHEVFVVPQNAYNEALDELLQRLLVRRT